MNKWSIGFHGPLLLRREVLGPQGGPRLKALFVSDLHLWRQPSESHLEHIEALSRSTGAELVLLGGDLLDSDRGLKPLKRLLRSWRSQARVLAVGGNHDRAYGLRTLRRLVLDEGGEWVGNQSVEVASKGRGARVERRLRPRQDAYYRILLNHEPDAFVVADRLGYDLMLAGHLHGCQFVLWQKGQELYPGRLFLEWNGLRYQDGASTMLVSRGAGDILPIRYRCPRELVLCDIGLA